MGEIYKPPRLPANLPHDPTETYGTDTWHVLNAIQERTPADPAGARPADDASVDSWPTQWANLDLKVLNIASHSGADDSNQLGEPAHSISGQESFTLHVRVAAGGFAEIWEATQEPLRRLIAIKRLRRDLLEELADEPDKAKAIADVFYQEALTTANLQHPNIVPVHDLGMDRHGQPLIAMKLVKGLPWPSCIKADWNMLPWEFFARHLPILIDVANAVAFAHTQGVIHRDLKPSQVMIGEFGEVVVMDWGLAIHIDRPGINSNKQPNTATSGKTPIFSHQSTMASSPAGTPSYMAPEQTQSDMSRIGPWTDIYLLGGMLYYLLTQSPPHYEDTSEAAFLKAAKGEVQPPSERAPERNNPPELEALAMKALSPDPDNRFNTMKEFIEALQDYLSGAGKHREATAIIDAVEKEFAGNPDNYRVPSEALASLARAEGLWRGNPRISPLRERVREAYARLALTRGDLNLARLQGDRLADPDTRQRIIHDVDKAQRKIEKTARERRMFLGAAAFFVVLLLFGAWRYIDDQQAALNRATQAEQAALLQKSMAEESAAAAERERQEAVKARGEAETARHNAEWEQYLASINSAYLYLQKGSVNLASDFLLHHTPEWARQWEWRYLRHLTHQEERLLYTATVGFEVYDARFNGDGSRIAVGDRSGTIMLWDADSGRQLVSRKVHTRGIWALEFSPDGSRLLTSSLDGSAAILNGETMEVELMLRGHTNYLRGAAWSRDGKLVATTSRDATVRIWSASDGSELKSLRYPQTVPYDVDFHPDGKTIGVACLGRYAALVDWGTGSVVKELQGHLGNVRTITFNSDGTRVATGASADQVLIFDTAAGNQLTALPVGNCTPNSVAFSPDGALLLLADSTGNARLWDWQKRELLGTMYASVKGWNAAFSRDGERIVTACDQQIRVWRTESVKMRAGLIASSEVPAATPAAHLRAISLPIDRGATWFGQDDVWLSGDWRRHYEKNDQIYRVDFYYHVVNPAGGSRIEIGYESANAVVHFDDPGRQPITLRAGNTYGAAFSPDGRLAATGSVAGILEIWDAQSWERRTELKMNGSMIGSLEFNRSSQRLAAGMADGSIAIIDAASGHVSQVIAAHDKLVLDIDFNRDGTRLISASSDKSAKIWNLETGNAEHVLIGHQEIVTAAAFSPDEMRALTASYDGTARLWDVRTGAPLLIVHDMAANEILTGADFSADGEEILVLNSKGQLAVHRAGP